MQSLFFSTPADRLALVRQRYFEEGELPSGSSLPWFASRA